MDAYVENGQPSSYLQKRSNSIQKKKKHQKTNEQEKKVGLRPLVELVTILVCNHKVAGSNPGDAGFFPSFSDDSPLLSGRLTEV